MASKIRYFSSNPEEDESEKILRELDSKEQRESPKSRKEEDPFAGPAPLEEKKVQTHKRGSENQTDVHDAKLKRKLVAQELKYQDAADQAARHDIFLLEKPGYLEADEGEKTYAIHQCDIRNHVDLATTCKQFELNLDKFGPYRINYTHNGRHLLLGGRRGHVAAFEWFSKKLTCEINVMESVNDVRWLHSENMFAVAQKKWTYVYDNQGIELHCLKNLHQVLCLDFLPYHFLLVAASATGFLHYLDISIGKIVSSIGTKANRLKVLAQNPHNAIMLLGHHNGTVTMWSPNTKEPLIKMLCHRNAVRAIAVDKTGLYMATSGQDNRIKIFDIRMYSPIHAYKVMYSPSCLKFSQRGLMAATCNNIVEVYRDPCREVQEEPYLVHKLRHSAEMVEFCPYEDVLGVGREDGFESLLIPGAGEPNYDSMESNPYRSKSQRREWEVKALMEKIQPEMISLDPFQIGSVDRVTADRLRKDKEERMGFKKEDPRFEPKFKANDRSSAGNIEKRKQTVRNAETRNKIKKDLERKRKMLEEESGKNAEAHTATLVAPKLALSRFKKR